MTIANRRRRTRPTTSATRNVRTRRGPSIYNKSREQVAAGIENRKKTRSTTPTRRTPKGPVVEPNRQTRAAMNAARRRQAFGQAAGKLAASPASRSGVTNRQTRPTRPSPAMQRKINAQQKRARDRGPVVETMPSVKRARPSPEMRRRMALERRRRMASRRTRPSTNTKRQVSPASKRMVRTTKYNRTR